MGNLIPKLLHKVLVELRDPPHPLRPGGQEGGPEMERAFFLSEAGPWHDADTRCVKKAGGVELVGLAIFLFGLFDGLLGELDGGEKVH